MEEENKVSIWLGYFDSRDSFETFVEEHYDKWGDVSSLFMSTFGIDTNFIDNQEILYTEKLTKEHLRRFSYANFFCDKIMIDIEPYNAVFLIYDFNYWGDNVKTNNLNFVGVFDYK